MFGRRAVRIFTKHVGAGFDSSSKNIVIVTPKMEKVEGISIGDMPASSPYLKAMRMLYRQNDRKERFWDFVIQHDSVSILLFNKSRNVLLFVKQFRPAVFYNMVVAQNKDVPVSSIDWVKFPAKLGITLELCAGILDNPNLTVKETAKQEVLEECGYDVPLENFSFMANYRGNVGSGGSSASMYFAEVTDSMKISSGGGKPEEGELIELIEMTIPQAREYIAQETVLSPSGLMFAVTWFLLNKVPLIPNIEK